MSDLEGRTRRLEASAHNHIAEVATRPSIAGGWVPRMSGVDCDLVLYLVARHETLAAIETLIGEVASASKREAPQEPRRG